MGDFLMDNEKCLKLLNDLRNADLPDSVMCDEAADEIERLVKDNASLVEENRKLKGSLDYAWRRIDALVQSAEEDRDLRMLNEALHADDRL